jgi:hypothetical protein
VRLKRPKKNLRGRKFGRLLVVCPTTDRNSQGSILWFCICSCGKSVPVDSYSLTSRHTQSCGCLQKEDAAKRGRNSRKRPFEFLYNELVRRAKNGKKEVGISYLDFLEFTREKGCHYCGKPLVWTMFSCENGVETKGIATNLDRVDPAQGYLKENLVPCCPNCNRGKSDCFSYEEWRVMTSALKAYWKGQ